MRWLSGLRKKIIAQFTCVNEQLFFERNEEKGLFGQTLFIYAFVKDLPVQFFNHPPTLKRKKYIIVDKMWIK